MKRIAKDRGLELDACGNPDITSSPIYRRWIDDAKSGRIRPPAREETAEEVMVIAMVQIDEPSLSVAQAFAVAVRFVAHARREEA